MPCDDCAYAEWKRTSNGRLHPDKSGRCKWTPPVFLVPKAYTFSSYGSPGEPPRLSGGFIERGAKFTDDCSCFQSNK